jgi:hypothetical protein
LLLLLLLPVIASSAFLRASCLWISCCFSSSFWRFSWRMVGFILGSESAVLLALVACACACACACLFSALPVLVFRTREAANWVRLVAISVPLYFGSVIFWFKSPINQAKDYSSMWFDIDKWWVSCSVHVGNGDIREGQNRR